MPEQTGEKTEKATPKKKEDARKKGNVAKSSEVNSALVLLAGTLVIALTGSYFFGTILFKFPLRVFGFIPVI